MPKTAGRRRRHTRKNRKTRRSRGGMDDPQAKFDLYMRKVAPALFRMLENLDDNSDAAVDYYYYEVYDKTGATGLIDDLQKTADKLEAEGEDEKAGEYADAIKRIKRVMKL